MQLPMYAQVQLTSVDSDIAIEQIEEGSEEEEVIEEAIEAGMQRLLQFSI